MSKTRVYELAQQMGIDNKELMAKLKAIGVEVTTHMAAIDDADIKKLTAPVTVKEVSQEEVRIKPTLIRRRAKIVETPVEEAPVEPPVEAAPVKGKPATAEVAEVPPSAPAETAKVAEAAERQPEKATPTRARILGTMILPGFTPKEKPAEQREAVPPRSTERPAPRPGTERPAQRPGMESPAPRPGMERPGAGRGAERPSPARGTERPSTPRSLPIVPLEAPSMGEDRRKSRKGKEFAAAGAKKGVAAAVVPKRKEEFKKTDLLEKHERVFEPGPRGKGKKRHAERVSIGKKTEITIPKAIKRVIRISESITVGELAKRMGTKANDLIRALMKMGVMATINHPLDVMKSKTLLLILTRSLRQRPMLPKVWLKDLPSSP